MLKFCGFVVCRCSIVIMLTITVFFEWNWPRTRTNNSVSQSTAVVVISKFVLSFAFVWTVSLWFLISWTLLFLFRWLPLNCLRSSLLGFFVSFDRHLQHIDFIPKYTNKYINGFRLRLTCCILVNTTVDWSTR